VAGRRLQRSRRADVEIAAAIGLSVEGGYSAAMLGIDFRPASGRPKAAQASKPPSRLGDLADDPPIRLCLARQGRKPRWREMRRSELVTVPSFSPQAAAGRMTCGLAGERVVGEHVFGDDEEIEPLQRALTASARAARRPGWSP
jgi:hypothetical protein